MFDTIFGCVSLSHTISHMIPPSMQVKGAGEWYVNGVYTTTPQRVRRRGEDEKWGLKNRPEK